MPGYISFNRDLLDELQFKTKIRGACRTVLIYLMWESNFKPGVFGGINLDRGELSVSVETISKNTGLSTKTVRNALRTLHAQKLIDQKRANEGANEGANKSLVYHIYIYDTYINKKNKWQTKGQTKGQVGGKQGANKGQTSKEEELKELKEEDQMQDQNLSDFDLDAGASVGQTGNPVSQLGDLVVEMGLPGDPSAYSWIGGLQKRFGVEVCRGFLDEQKLRGTSLADFKDAKAFRAYFTAAIIKRAEENGRAAATESPGWKIFDGGDDKPIKDPERRLRRILVLRREYSAYKHLNTDPDKGKPGCTWALPDDVIQKAIAEQEDKK